MNDPFTCALNDPFTCAQILTQSITLVSTSAPACNLDGEGLGRSGARVIARPDAKRCSVDWHYTAVVVDAHASHYFSDVSRVRSTPACTEPSSAIANKNSKLRVQDSADRLFSWTAHSHACTLLCSHRALLRDASNRHRQGTPCLNRAGRGTKKHRINRHRAAWAPNAVLPRHLCNDSAVRSAASNFRT